jgi:hypothetical protein
VKAVFSALCRVMHLVSITQLMIYSTVTGKKLTVRQNQKLSAPKLRYQFILPSNAVAPAPAT